MNRISGRTGIVLLLAILLLGGFVFFLCDYAANADRWILFTGSPHVYNGDELANGVVTDREGVLLVNMDDSKSYSNLETIRQATVHWLGDRQGNISAPMLNHYARQLAGYDVLSGIYAYGDQPPVTQLTLSAKVQVAALEAMGQYKGALAVYNYKTGELLCAVSTPTFDPDDAPVITEDNAEQFEGVYLNRFVQSLYVPGSIFKIVTLAAALETIPDVQQMTFVCYGSYEYGVDKITCEGAHWEQDLQTAFCNSCNCAFAQLSQLLDPAVLDEYARSFGLTEPYSFDGFTTNAGSISLSEAAPVNVAWGSIGQYTDQINPCTFLTFVGAIAGNGKAAKPYVVQSITHADSQTYCAGTKLTQTLISKQTAQTIQKYMRFNVETKYGDGNFPGLTVCAKTGTAEVGGGKKPNAMLAGFVTDAQYPLAFIVAVEDGGYGSTVCIPIMSKVLAACKEALG